MRRNFLHVFGIHSSSRHEKGYRMLERLFCLFQCSRNIGCGCFKLKKKNLKIVVDHLGPRWHPYSTLLLFPHSLLGRFNFKRQPEAPHNTQKKGCQKVCQCQIHAHNIYILPLLINKTHLHYSFATFIFLIHCKLQMGHSKKLCILGYVTISIIGGLRRF